MSNQVAISVRLDKGVSERLTLEVGASGRTRNRIINDACRLYLEYVDACRRVACGTESKGHMTEDMYQRWSKYFAGKFPWDTTKYRSNSPCGF